MAKPINIDDTPTYNEEESENEGDELAKNFNEACNEHESQNKDNNSYCSSEDDTPLIDSIPFPQGNKLHYVHRTGSKYVKLEDFK